MQSHKKALAILLSLAVAIGIVTAATASAGHHAGLSVTGFPTQISQVDLDGYKIVTSYPLGNNTGNTFQQTYLDHSVSAFATKGPDVGAGTFLSTYIALPVGHNMLFVTWLRARRIGVRRVPDEFQHRDRLRRRATEQAADQPRHRAHRQGWHTPDSVVSGA